jgi:hypothetical protein
MRYGLAQMIVHEPSRYHIGEGGSLKVVNAAQRSNYGSAEVAVDRCGWCTLLLSSVRSVRVGPFVPKPSRGEGHQACRRSDLGSSVRRCPLASVAEGGDCYSLGYSPVRRPSAFQV